MSSQPPNSEPPPSEPAAAGPDAETARVPVEPTPTQPPAGLISAQPTGPVGGQGGGPSPNGPVVAWTAPAGPAAIPVAEGVVIAGVFARLVAYSTDLLFLGSIGVAIDGALGLFDAGRNETVALVVSIILVVVDFAYFVGLWSSGWQATLGMRMLRLRVLGATSAGTLSPNDALLRWLALSGAVGILTLVPGVNGFIGLLSLVWLVVLLGTTAADRLHQGLHDRWARSVVVQPAPGGSGAAFATCLILLVLVFVILPVLALALAADQVAQILSQIGNSI